MRIFEATVRGKNNPKFWTRTHIAVLAKGEGELYLEDKLDFSQFGIEESDVLFYFSEGKFKDEDAVWETEEFLFERRKEIKDVCL